MPFPYLQSYIYEQLWSFLKFTDKSYQICSVKVIFISILHAEVKAY